MRARSKLRVIIYKADRAFQDFLRREYQGTPCEAGCGQVFELGHHVVEKSKSAFLRYDIRNIALICSRCHAKHHLAGDPAILATILKKKGMEWFDTIQKLRRTTRKLDRYEAEKELEKYKP